MGEWHGNENSTYFGDGVNWDAMTHQQLWDWFSQPRTDGMQNSVSAWMETVGGHLQAAADKVNASLRTAGVHWEGTAADSMRESTAPLASHALAAKDIAASVADATLGQVMASRTTALAMPEPKPMPKQSDLLSLSAPELLLRMVDVHEQEKAASEAEERARDLVRTYDAGADDAVGGLPRFEEAPRATVSKAEPGATIEVPDPRPSGPGPGGGPDGGPGIGSGPGYTTSGPDSTPSRDPVVPQGGDVQPGATSGQGWSPPASSPTGGGSPPTPGVADTPRLTNTAPVTGGFVGSGGPGPSSGTPRGGAPGGGRLGRTPGGGAAPGERVGAGGRAVLGEAAAARGGSAATGRGAGMGMAPAGAGKGKGDEDTEHTSPEYLRDYNDEFWDDTPPVAPAVIGDDEDE